MAYGLDIFDYDEERDGRYTWLRAAQWATPPYRPLFGQCWYLYSRLGTLLGSDMWAWPGSKGWDYRMYRGADFYFTIVLTTEEEKKAREPMYRERMAPILDDPFGTWEKYKQEFQKIYDRLYAFDVVKAGDGELGDHFCDCWDSNRIPQHLHIWMPYAQYGSLLLFQQLCPELTGIAASDVRFAKLMSGFDTMLNLANKGLAELATKTIELGISGLFDTLEPEELLSTLEESGAGRKWLEAFRGYLKVYGQRTPRVQDFTITWLEKPSLAIPDIKRMIAAGGIHAPEMHRERLVAEREEAEKEVLSKVRVEQREWFEKLMRCAQAAHFWSEDHIYYIEFYGFWAVRRAALELGRRYVSRGMMDDPEDIMFLVHDEVVMPAMLGRDRFDLHPLVQRRKEQWEASAKAELPLVLGDPTKFPEMVAADPIMNIAIAAPIAKPEEVGATVVGAAGAPGVAEGTARVIYSFDQLNELQPDEILVTIFTAVPWTPAFGMIKALVTDVGGEMCHSTIVAREYGIPAVCGTMEATTKITTGQKIRVDGNLLRVYVIE